MESLSANASSGTASDRTRVRNTAAANKALAANGVKLGACGKRRAMTSRPISPVPSRRSGAMAKARHIDIRETDRIFHLLQGAKAPWQSTRFQAAMSISAYIPSVQDCQFQWRVLSLRLTIKRWALPLALFPLSERTRGVAGFGYRSNGNPAPIFR